MRDRFGVLAALGVRDGQHVQRVIVVGILVAHQAQVGIASSYRPPLMASVDAYRRSSIVCGAASRGVAWRWQMFR